VNVQLVLMRKNKRIWTAQLRRPEATIGRAHGCTIRIPSAEVSRLHCRLRIEEGLVTVEDLESVNGTFVNDTRVQDPEIVHPGDRLTLGPITFLVEYELPTETLRPLGSAEAKEDKETSAEVDVEILEESGAHSAVKPQPTESFEVEEVETIPLSEQEDLHVTDGDHLRDFLIELDQSDSHPGEK
jgi:pSer/pThr/pTyr-binding forkhead associated (FHA) protein